MKSTVTRSVIDWSRLKFHHFLLGFTLFPLFQLFQNAKIKIALLKKSVVVENTKLFLATKNCSLTWFTLATFRYSTPIFTVRIDKSEIERPRVNKKRKKLFQKQPVYKKREKRRIRKIENSVREKCYS